MSADGENEVARLKQLNGEFESSIKRCRAILKVSEHARFTATNLHRGPAGKGPLAAHESDPNWTRLGYPLTAL